MTQLFYELSVLSKAVAHKNLSSASRHVGLSQPQLSRIIKKIEENFSVVLLDRATKRFATWTPAALKLSDFFNRKMRAFDNELESLVLKTQTKQLVVGTLEGLIPVALPAVKSLFEVGIRLVELDVFDLDRLESLFSRGELDLIFTSREPGRRKFNYVQTIGYQAIETVQSNSRFQIFSTYEYGAKGEPPRQDARVLISNSLQIRMDWLARFGGTGTLPSEPSRKAKSKKETEPVLMVGSDTLSKSIWDQLGKMI